jgi:hypothetical protein
MNLPKIGDRVLVRFPLSAQYVTITELLPTSCKGTTDKGKLVTVRSYKMITGCEDWTPPGKQYDSVMSGSTVIVTSGRGTRTVIVQSDGGDSFTDTTGKQWPKARLRSGVQLAAKLSNDPVGKPVVPRERPVPGHTLPEVGEIGLSRIKIAESHDGYTITRNGEIVKHCNNTVEVVNFLRSIQ